ncbi:SMI1/KNR4 family protein [Streptomyces rubellomurinus]|uniref:Knr4/Smi1-like domain-containing protein n=1 Tax=Streptomyces rubellomurinus (strain ATCC 31215) TaxID=359131 RepID=A0A0F2TJW7_STRR3|nr:SMI1/KNR4 family protein [Streptomyces rubellomurinus]KJS62007.1 hypothetical protein VM95_11785 [Streptomyces rubellomurinus]
MADIQRRLAALASGRPGRPPRSSGRPVDAAAVRELEAFLGAPLPAAVALFLTEIGLGVGPYGGFLAPEKIRYEVQLDRDDCADDGIPVPDLAAPFPITAQDVRTRPFPMRPLPLDGAVRIGQQGCGRWTVLALTGELAGTVWDLDGEWAERTEWRPAAHWPEEPPASGPVHFLDWVERWLDRQ